MPSVWFLYPIQIKNLKDHAISEGWVLKQQLCKTLSKSPYCMFIFEQTFSNSFGCLHVLKAHAKHYLITKAGTGKSFSEALILASTNPQYEKRLFIELQVQYMKIASSEHVVYINCSECQNKSKKQFVCTTCSELTTFMY